MGEVVEIGRVLHDTPDLFPWVCLAIIMFFIVKERKELTDILRAMADYFRTKKQNDILMVEVVRNNSITTEHNTAALERNTEMMKTVMDDRRETRAMVENHETLSRERMQHLQEVLNRVDRTVTGNSQQIGLIEDRTSKRRSD